MGAHNKTAITGVTNSANNLNILCNACHDDSEYFSGEAY